MSRIGKQPIHIPSGVTVTVDGSSVSVKGPKGALMEHLHAHVRLLQHDDTLEFTVEHPDEKSDRALWGLSRMLVFNMVTGVTDGFTKALEVHGVGYRITVNGTKVVLNLGFSHPVEFQLPEGITAKVEGNTLTLGGTNKQLVGETAARIRAFRKPEPYKGKGIRYVGEAVRRKAGKVMKSGE